MHRERMLTSTRTTSSEEAEVPQDYFITIYKFFFVNLTKMLVIKIQTERNNDGLGNGIDGQVLVAH